MAESIYTIPLRKEFSKVAEYKRTRRSITEIRNFIKNHMKVDEVKIGKHLNKKMHECGRKNPPNKIQVKAVKEENKAKVELVNVEFEKPKEEVKKPAIPAAKEKLEEQVKGEKPVEKVKSKPIGDK